MFTGEWRPGDDGSWWFRACAWNWCITRKYPPAYIASTADKIRATPEMLRKLAADIEGRMPQLIMENETRAEAMEFARAIKDAD